MSAASAQSSGAARSPSARARDVWIIIGYFVAALLLAAALAPPLYWAAGATVDFIASRDATKLPVAGYVHHHFAKADFTRVFNRALMGAALICLWPAARLLRVGRGQFGLAPNPTPWRHLTLGFLVGAGLLVALGAIYVACGFFTLKKSVAWGGVIFDSLLRAAGAGVLEELFFRGALLGLMLRANPPGRALVIVTTIFAAVHFLQAPAEVGLVKTGVEWNTGFWLLGQILRHFGQAEFLLAEFATLWVAGCLLGAARLRTRSLWLPIGLHSGWIFAIGLLAGAAKASKAVSRGEFLPWIDGTLKSGLVPLGALALTGVILITASKGRSRPG